MAGKSKKREVQEQQNDTRELFEAIALLEKERGIPAGSLVEKIQSALLVAVRKDYGDKDNITVVMDPGTQTFEVTLHKTVVEEVEDPDTEIALAEALTIRKAPAVGDVLDFRLDPKKFGRIAAQTAKHVIRQGLRDAERGQQLQEFQSRNQELVTALVSRVDPRTGAATLEIGKAETVLPRNEQLEDDRLTEGSRVRVYVVEVRDSERGPRALVSRTHPGFVRRLFEMEVPELYNGDVEIKAIAREAGSRTKMAVCARDENVDAVGSCIGPRGARVNSIIDELGGEKIDVVEYSDDPAAFIAAALAPAKVVNVEILDDAAKACRVTVPDNQLSLAIGNKGQNARMAAKLTGWKIDIRPESGVTETDAPAEEN